MRKIFTLITILFALSAPSIAQTNVLCEDFTDYDTSTASANYHNWTFSYFSQYSFYSSVASTGIAPNSYKFGVDSATVITPNINGATYFHFWMKGNASSGGSLANGKFYIYESPDSITYTLVDMISPIPAFVEMVKEYPLSVGTSFVKFFYDKDSGNVAFDDFCATIGAVGVGINETSQNKSFSIYPNPSRGLSTIDVTNLHSKNAIIIVNNVLGKEIKKVELKNTETNYLLDLSNCQDGVYFIKVKTDAGDKIQRIVLRK